jgi:hypothetical protein
VTAGAPGQALLSGAGVARFRLEGSDLSVPITLLFAAVVFSGSSCPIAAVGAGLLLALEMLRRNRRRALVVSADGIELVGMLSRRHFAHEQIRSIQRCLGEEAPYWVIKLRSGEAIALTLHDPTELPELALDLRRAQRRLSPATLASGPHTARTRAPGARKMLWRDPPRQTASARWSEAEGSAWKRRKPLRSLPRHAPICDDCGRLYLVEDCLGDPYGGYSCPRCGSIELGFIATE